ncbi:MAG: maleylpyruvate isomerase family mycothiol-dependent enzyme [Acidimicrobiales bacterium]
MPTEDADLQPLVAADYLALADLLEGLSPQRWDTPSLCEGWRVREVVAHVTMPARYAQEAFMAELSDCGFDFTTVSNRIAARDAELSVAELVGNLRDEALHYWTPPDSGHQDALSHVVIHGLDITVALGEPRRSPDPTIVAVLDGLTTGGGHAHFGTDIDGRTVQATDIDWSYGSGPPLSATAEDLVLYICGRQIPAGRLQGDPIVR